MASKLVLIVLLLITSSSISIIAEDEEDAVMIKLMEALTPTPHGWSNNTSHCNWTGITCDKDFKTVTRIQLSGHSLTGVLPSNLNDLSDLKQLNLSQNNLTGPVPFLTDLFYLKNVDLSFNNFTSINNDSFQGLLSLRRLILANNLNLAPWTFSTYLNLSKTDTVLEFLSLTATNLYSTLPDIFTSFPRLRKLHLSDNNLTGEIPRSLAHTEIEFLSLNNQRSGFTGSIALLSSLIHLYMVKLQHNKFTGHIPDLTNLYYLRELRLDNNFLTGTVPSSLADLPRLKQVSLENNMLRGPLPKFAKHVNLTSQPINRLCPKSDGLCDQMVLLNIAQAFGNPIQLASSWRWNNTNCQHWSFIVCQQGKVVAVNLASQGLTGLISPSFANLSDLKNLNLSENNLRDSIPKSLTTLLRLESLDLSYNNLSGEVPIFPARVKLNITNNPLLQISQRHPPVVPIPWIAGALAVASIGFVMFIIVVIYNRKRRLNLTQEKFFKKVLRAFFNHNDEEDFMKGYSPLALKRYRCSEISKMTNSFQNKLGQGGFGVVYKATLPDGRFAAIKIINDSKGSEEEFINELVSISRTSHINIVSLWGFCYEKNNRKALVYEFLSNGSLEKFIYKNESPGDIHNLDLHTMHKIAVGIAQGLEYLHKRCPTKIIHLDIKPQNILLDEDFCPKISDFGLAKLCKRKENTISFLGTRGTIGYIAPEVLTRRYGKISHKSDVYSYGMLIFEMIGGRKHFENRTSHTSDSLLPDLIYKDVLRDHFHSSYSLMDEQENELVKKMTMVSLWCIQTNPINRPCINKVIEMLEGPLQSVPFPPKPTPYYSPNNKALLQFSDTSSSIIVVPS